MASSSKNPLTWSWSWSQHHHVDSDDWVQCCVAGSWFPYWFTITDCKHHCVGINELDSCTRIDIVATCGCLSLYRPLQCDCTIDCDSSIVDYHTNSVCVHFVSCSSNSSVMEIKAQQSARFSSVHGDDHLEHCVSSGLGGVFHFVEEPSSHRYNYRGTHWGLDGCLP